MDTFLTATAIVVMIALGAFLIHRLNGLHADRIAQRQYSRRPPGHRGAHDPAQRPHRHPARRRRPSRP